MKKPVAVLADDIATRVGYFGMGEYFERFDWLAKGLLSRPSKNLEQFEVVAPTGLIALRLLRVADDGVWTREWDNIALFQVTFLEHADLPFRLSWETETLESAAVKLSNDSYAFGDKASYFSDDLIISLHFKHSGPGLTRVIAARIGPTRDWRSRVI